MPRGPKLYSWSLIQEFFPSFVIMHCEPKCKLLDFTLFEFLNYKLRLAVHTHRRQGNEMNIDSFKIFANVKNWWSVLTRLTLSSCSIYYFHSLTETWACLRALEKTNKQTKHLPERSFFLCVGPIKHNVHPECCSNRAKTRSLRKSFTFWCLR